MRRLPQFLKPGCNHSQPQHGPEGQLKAHARQQRRGQRQHAHPCGAQQMQGDPRPVAQRAILPQKHQQRRADHRRIQPGEQAVQPKEHRRKHKAPSAGQPCAPQKRRHCGKYQPHMQPGHRQQMRNAQPFKGFPIFLGHLLPAAQQHGGGITARLLAHDRLQLRSQAAPYRRGHTRQTAGSILRRQTIPAVDPHQHPLLQQRLPEVIALRVCRALGMIHPRRHGYAPARGNLRRKLLPFSKVKAPVCAAGKQLPIQGNIPQHSPHLPVGTMAKLRADDAGYTVVPFRGKCRVVRPLPQHKAQRQHHDHDRCPSGLSPKQRQRRQGQRQCQ